MTEKPPGSFIRGSIKKHDVEVVTPEQVKRFKSWAKSFGENVAEVLLSADLEDPDLQPARDCYARFGWWKGMPARYIAGWWQHSIRVFEEDENDHKLPVYRAAFRDILAVL